MSHTSSKEKEHTVAPRCGAISTSPSASSIVRACLTGVLLTPSCSASCSSIKRSSGPHSPVRIKARNRSKTPTGRDPLPLSRNTCPTRPPLLTYGEPLVYNLRRPRTLRQEFQERGGGSWSSSISICMLTCFSGKSRLLEGVPERRCKLVQISVPSEGVVDGRA